ncbi:uncharacterized protein BDZ99DRAFT_467180 [Mytilinidion resinicola]|uniref:Uncharacterized protein n=1 Tax=Mytilinidion resinicola TaxID=574789 RepID=A0A6A6Y8M0_9PEZI|nr:uncharacterized protein BDZ99DRAFT_467180 [Mytilinidion resinicola]KAF2804959.1 hypothetical protein BDZ99DRAFT_467180 [Mytilinidion resinicola]
MKLGEGPLQCNPAWNCYDAIHESYVLKALTEWESAENTVRTLYADPDKDQLSWGKETHSAAVYEFSARWTKGCTAESSHEVFGGDWQSVFMSTWKDCDDRDRNSGAGGWHQEGCVAYGFFPWCDT